MTSAEEAEAAAAPAPAETVTEPEVPVVDIPPDESISSETLADKSVAEEAKEDMVMEEPSQEAAAAEAVVETTETTETTTAVTTEVTEVVTTVEVATEEATVETPMETTTETSLGKREREETENGADESKKLKVDDNGKEEKEPVAPVKLGPKVFHSGIEMFTYFYDLLHGWIANVDINKYEHMVLADLITKGHRDAESKIGSGIKAFQIRFHSGWHSRCYYLVRTDGSVEDFSYRKCVDRLMPLPESLFSPSGDLIVDRLFGSTDQDNCKGKGKGAADNGEREGKGHQGYKGRGGGGGWRGGKGGRGGRGKRW